MKLAFMNIKLQRTNMNIHEHTESNHTNELLNQPFIILLTLIFLCLNGTNLFAKDKKHQQAVDSLAQILPEKLMTIVDKTLDDQFAKIERSLSKLPGISKKDVFLITLPLENYIEDIYFPANRPAIIYPRAIFLIIYEEINKEKSKKTIAQHLVELQQKNEFKKIFKQKLKKNE